jgi:hypothetical protein
MINIRRYVHGTHLHIRLFRSVLCINWRIIPKDNL